MSEPMLTLTIHREHDGFCRIECKTDPRFFSRVYMTRTIKVESADQLAIAIPSILSAAAGPRDG